MVIFARLKQTVACILFSALNVPHRGIVSGLVHYLADQLPLILLNLPHVGFGNSVVLENLDFSLSLTSKLAFNLCIEVK